VPQPKSEPFSASRHVALEGRRRVIAEEELDELRGSRPVLGARGGEIPPCDSPNTLAFGEIKPQSGSLNLRMAGMIWSTIKIQAFT
jgi:hypothetical protein